MKRLHPIKIKDIAVGDRRFELFSETPGGGVLNRLQGVFPAPLLWKKDGVWLVVAGEVKSGTPGKTEISAWTYPENASCEEVLTDLLDAERKVRELNVFDIARVIRFLEAHCAGHDPLLWSRRLGIGRDQWAMIRDLDACEPEWKNYFVNKHVPLKRISVFSDPRLRERLGPLLALNPGINVLETIAVLLSETARRETCGFDACWMSAGLDGILENTELSAAARLNAIREALTQRRYPNMTEYRRRMKRQMEKLKVPPEIRLETDPDFETPGIALHARIEKRQDIVTLRSWLDEQEDKLDGLLQIQQGEEAHDQE